MRPTDGRVRRQLAVARRPLVLVVLAGVLTSLVVIAQAFALTGLVVALVDGRDLTRPIALVVACYLAKALVGAVADLAAARAAARVSADLRTTMAEAVLDARTDTISDGELTALATRGVAAAEPFLTRYVPAVALAAVLPALTVLVIATQDLLSAGIVLATVPLIPLFGALVGLATRDRAEAQWRSVESLSGHFVDVLNGLPTLVAFRRADAQGATIRSVTNRCREATLRTLRVAFASSAVLELVATLSVALVAVVVGLRLAGGHVDLRTGLVVLLLAPEAYWPLRRMGAEFHASAEGMATFARMADLAGADEPTGVTAPPSSHRLLIADGVGHTFPGRRTPALATVGLAAAPGSLTAITGPSGCGKSTLLQVLAGLVVPTSGSVTCGGVDAGSAVWRSQVAWVPQRPTFTPGSVADNLRLAAPDATDAALWDALDTVALAERVRLLGGLGESVGEDGALLSAGERARLALARAVLSGRGWVLLDEPTAHLDPVTRQVLVDVVVALSRTAGVVVVTHEPAIVAVADRVVELGPVPAGVDPATALLATPGAAPVLARTEAPSPAPGFALSTVLGILSACCGVALTATAGWLIVKAAEHPAALTMMVAIVGVRTFGLGRPVFRYVERLRSHDNALKLLAERRVAIYRDLVPLTPGRLGKRRGDVLAAVVDDVDAVVDRELRVRLPLRTYAVVTVLAAALAAFVLPEAGLVVAVTAGLGGLGSYLVARLGTRLPERTVIAARADLSSLVLDTASRAPEIRMWQAEPTVLRPLAALNRRFATATTRAAAAGAAARVVGHLAVALGVALVALVGADALAAGTVTAPRLALLLLLPVALGEVAAGVVDAAALVERVQAAERRLQAFRTSVPAVTDPAEPEPAGTAATVEVLDGTLGWDAPVITGVDLRLDAGERVAVVGPSGSGKSTLAGTLIRFIDPIAGSVSLGGSRSDTILLDDVRARVGLVSDDPHVFATTVVENVRLARPGATDDQVEGALRQAHLGTWLDGLPDGLHTWIGDGHDLVSGGERARLGLARSLLADQPVLVLDEPVAHLDRLTAEQVAADLLDATDGRTVLWITHSDVGLDRVDRVVDLGR